MKKTIFAIVVVTTQLHDFRDDASEIVTWLEDQIR